MKSFASSYDDLLVLIEMGDEEEDLSLVGEITENLEDLKKGLGALRLQTLLTGEYDNNNAILTFHAGAGGTEAMDWVSMLDACIRAGASAMALRCSCSTFWTVTKRDLKAR